MRHRRLAFVFFVVPAMAGFMVAAAAVGHAGEQRAVLELFTSQGCSSCPAADKLLGELSTDPALVALSVPVDYWDYLGWKDTLASPGDSERQRAYAKVRGDRQVYTPQIVVNGATHVLGSDRAAVERAITQTDQRPSVMSLPVELSIDAGTLTVQVQAAENEPNAAEVWLCPLAKAVTVTIDRGENHGRTITYHTVVRGWRKLGDWSGAKTAWNVPLDQIKTDGIDAAAVLVQQGSHDRPGIILGAAYLPMP